MTAEAVYFGVTCAARALAMDAPWFARPARLPMMQSIRPSRPRTQAKADAEFALGCLPQGLRTGASACSLASNRSAAIQAARALF